MFLFPVFTFLILNNPHDCYECLSKNPDRIYSRFQLTYEERARRQFIAKFNSELEKNMANDENYIQTMIE